MMWMMNFEADEEVKAVNQNGGDDRMGLVDSGKIAASSNLSTPFNV